MATEASWKYDEQLCASIRPAPACPVPLLSEHLVVKKAAKAEQVAQFRACPNGGHCAQVSMPLRWELAGPAGEALPPGPLAVKC